MGIRRVLDNLPRIALRLVAGPSIPAIQPVHVPARIRPDTENQHHAARKRLAHPLDPAPLLRPLGSRLAIRIGNGVDLQCTPGNGDSSVGNRLAVLGIRATDLDELVVGGNKLGGDGELAVGVDRLGRVVAVKVVHAVRVLVVAASPLVADTLGLAALGLPRAAVHLRFGARVRDEGVGARVGLPDVHLVAAGAVGVVDVGLWR